MSEHSGVNYGMSEHCRVGIAGSTRRYRISIQIEKCESLAKTFEVVYFAIRKRTGP